MSTSQTDDPCLRSTWSHLLEPPVAGAASRTGVATLVPLSHHSQVPAMKETGAPVRPRAASSRPGREGVLADFFPCGRWRWDPEAARRRFEPLCAGPRLPGGSGPVSDRGDAVGGADRASHDALPPPLIWPEREPVARAPGGRARPRRAEIAAIIVGSPGRSRLSKTLPSFPPPATEKAGILRT